FGPKIRMSIRPMLVTHRSAVGVDQRFSLGIPCDDDGRMMPLTAAVKIITNDVPQVQQGRRRPGDRPQARRAVHENLMQVVGHRPAVAPTVFGTAAADIPPTAIVPDLFHGRTTGQETLGDKIGPIGAKNTKMRMMCTPPAFGVANSQIP